MNLFKLTAAQSRIDDMLEDSVGVITPDIAKAMGELDKNQKAAMAQIATIALEAKEKFKAIKAIARFYADKAKAYEAAEKSIKNHLLKYLEDTDQRKIEYENIKIRRQASPPSVLVTDTEAVPDKFKRATITVSVADLETIKAFGIIPETESYEVNKSAIIQAWKDSKKKLETSGTEMLQKEHVRIS